MKLEHRAIVKCPPEKAIAYFHDLPRYCSNHSLKGVVWEMLSEDTFRQTMDMGRIGKTECVYRVALLPDGLFAVILSGQGPGTMEQIRVAGVETARSSWIFWTLAPNLEGTISQAIRHLLRDSQLAKMMEKSLKMEAKVDIEYLEKA